MAALLGCLAPEAAAGDEAGGSAFRAAQQRHPRVRGAYASSAPELARLFAAQGLKLPPGELFVRILKRERRLELWAGAGPPAPLRLVKVYEVCGFSGELGPKRREGDGQIPEGVYAVDHFNPASRFHLSLRLDYPNRADRRREASGRLGGDIFVHGSCATIGCVPIGDDGIRELYVAAVEARAAGQARIPVHVFPARLDPEGRAELDRIAQRDPRLGSFWRSLAPVYDAFERTRRVPDVEVDAAGGYRVKGSPALPAPP